MTGSEDGFVEGLACPTGPTPKRQRVRPAAGSSDVEAADEDVDSGVVRGEDTEASGSLPPPGILATVSGKPPVHKGPEKEGKEPGIVTKELERPIARVDAGGITPALRNRASLRNTALRSVLKVFVMKCDPNYAQPWQMRPQRSSSGSAFVICSESRRILTNAHVVSNATTVYVRRPGNPKKWRARVACEGRICDLALLTVDEDAFWAEPLQGVQFVDVPELQDTILVAGYPMGGDSLSITKGIVSRVTMTRYTHSSNKLLGIQIDAAINPGNSGGPAFVNLERGQVAGVAFSKLSHADNVGYIIPYKIVCHFLEEYAQYGEFRGSCALGFRWQDLENKHMKEFYGMDPASSGTLVYKLDPLAPAAEVLEEGDVVLEVDNVPIADDGTIEFRDDERVEFTHLVRSKHVGDHLQLKVLRNRQVMDISCELRVQRPLVPIVHGVDCVPSYIIAGGLVLVPLSIPFLEHAYGGLNWRKSAPVSILAMLNEFQTFPDEQVVVLFQVLAAEINFGYKFQTIRVEEFNGTPVKNLRHLADMLDTTTEKYMKFCLEGGKLVVFDSAEARAAGPKILEQHAITYDRSVDLRATHSEAQPTDGMLVDEPAGQRHDAKSSD
mmetsp:Transcript_2030/g.5998  ORF Transcript_2030/g.5998 Transcript_2030/m.5998 type:complete len:611 (-) Transcript_2030:181-2013(-)|eukprot:CAMPEP_0117653068 /NCGR_PEP_ID=MMETSP0804-20121206/2989_1 /TAXON_ID=1074897 /ORGANISM="Tetraselmis astigmatica, Strain CCMP880" /LENGTH=610 /DNA_ID=CAMNT_0005459209 /DNA_START=49 /DNA_END=1881 /DNA_ORIENTATION=-